MKEAVAMPGKFKGAKAKWRSLERAAGPNPVKIVNATSVESDSWTRLEMRALCELPVKEQQSG